MTAAAIDLPKWRERLRRALGRSEASGSLTYEQTAEFARQYNLDHPDGAPMTVHHSLEEAQTASLRRSPTAPSFGLPASEWAKGDLGGYAPALSTPKKKRSWLWEKIVVTGAAILKWGALLLKFGAFKTTAITMVISVVVYSFFFGPLFSLAFVGLIFCHEMGHWLMAKRMGMDVSAPMFIPMLGALINMKKMPTTVAQEAVMAASGPVTGTLVSLMCLGVAALTHSQFAGAVAYEGCFLNLFNLMPVMPLDGGRVISALSKWFNLAGLLVLIAYTAWAFTHNGPAAPILLLIIVVSFFSTYHRFRTSRLQPEYLATSVRNRTLVGLGYLAMVLVSGWGMGVSYVYLTYLQHVVR